ncbi:MAG: hypothetical protein ACTSUO_06890 [Candidatus Thorarchaeota archaeon]
MSEFSSVQDSKTMLMAIVVIVIAGTSGIFAQFVKDRYKFISITKANRRF